MTPETKAWVDDLKNFYKEDVHEQTSHTLAFMNLPKAIQIIESQDKEIERLKGNLHEGQERWRNVLHVLPDQNDIPSNLLEALHDFTKK